MLGMYYPVVAVAKGKFDREKPKSIVTEEKMEERRWLFM